MLVNITSDGFKKSIGNLNQRMINSISLKKNSLIKLLVSPRYDYMFAECIPPLAIANLASFLRSKGLTIDLDDLHVKIREDLLFSKNKLMPLKDTRRVIAFLKNRTEDFELAHLVSEILKKTDFQGYDLIGFSIYYVSDYYMSLLLAKKIKELSDTIIIFGGMVHILGEIDDVLKNYNFIDYIMCGQNENSLFKFMTNFKKESFEKDIPSLVYRNKETILKNSSELFPFEEKSKPDFSGLPLSLYKYNYIINGYFSGKISKVTVLPYQLMTGCIGKCSYCQRVDKKGNYLMDNVIFKPIDKIVGELEHLSKKYKTKYFFFLDNEINFSYDFLDKLCRTLIQKKINIYWTDSAIPINLDKALLMLMRKAGCVKLVFGIESANNNILKKMNRKYTIEDAIKLLKESHEAGIWNEINFITGFINETETEIQNNESFFYEQSDIMDSLNLSGFWVKRNTKIHMCPEEFGIKFLNDNSINNNPAQIGILSYNELNNKKWEKKKQSIIESRNR
jgi:tRNA A37 methylthiotransferase MiaB